MANKKISALTQRSPDGTEYIEVIIPPFTPGTNRKVLLQEALDLATGGTGTVETIVAGTNITVDDSDPANPIVSATGGGGGGTWGSITGTLSSQTDLQDALNAKQATLTAALFGDFLVALTGKTTPVDADVITLSDSAASDDAKKVTLTNLKAFLKTYFDTIYSSPIGVHDLYVSASAMWPRVTSGCSVLTQYEMTTSLFNIQGLEFSDTDQQFAQFQAVLPRKWNGGTVTATIYWKPLASGSGTVQWGISGGAYSNDDALTVALGTPQTVDDTFLATDDLHQTSVTSAITIAGTPADQDFLAFQISRNPASDTLAVNAILLGVSIRITTDAAIDA